MTAREFFNKMEAMGCADIPVRVQYRDGGGDYFGFDELGSEEDYGIYHDEKHNVVYI